MHKSGLSIIIPTFNEAANIKLLIKKIVWIFIENKTPYEIIVIDDHSTDQTRRIVSACSKEYPVRLVEKRGSQGKGYSIVEAYAESMYEYIAILDADTDADELEDYFLRLFNLAKENGFAFARIHRTPLARLLSLSPFQGPKIFRREIFDYLDQDLVSAWVIGTPLIQTARELGYKGGALRIGISHARRPKPLGQRIVRWAQKMRSSVKAGLRIHRAFPFLPEDGESMRGAGVAYKQHRFITHTTLPAQLSALTTFAPWQIAAIIGVSIAVAIGVVVDTRQTLIGVTAVLSFIYLLDVLFNLVVTLKSLQIPPEITVSDDKVRALSDKALPMYSVLCPLYKEAQVLPQFVEAMNQLDWPKDKLEVILLLEEDDTATIRAAEEMGLPQHFRILVVPDSNPKTKPKACNYGLAHAKGEYIVIFDAEDKPDPLQLKKAYIAFTSSRKNVACLQAKLNYYNPHHNLLTRLFTAEYSLWFDVILPGLQSINTSIPLGGTSNHFRTSVLRDLEGWDPFNVTEDADLGTRLFSAGYKTAIIDSTTLEEANSDVKNWFRQRSRWLKGYMQTYLVHMRHPLKLLRQQGWHAFIFQLVVGGKISFILINPILWIMTLSYFILYPIVGVAIESIYPPLVFYMAVTSLIVGNFIAFYNYMIGCVKRGHDDLVKYVYLVPFYWLAISGAAMIALYQLIIRPHYWEKTIHGLHLIDNFDGETKRVIRARKIQKIADSMANVWNAGGVMVMAAVIGHFLNFAYNAYLSRRLNLVSFGEISLFGSLLYISSIPISALSKSTTHTTAYLLGKYGVSVKRLWHTLRKQVVMYATYASVLWIVAIPFLQKFFNFPSSLPFILFIPVWIVSSLSAVNGGYLAGNLIFAILAITTILEPVTKLVFAALFINIGFSQFVYASTALSMLTVLAVEWWQINKTQESKLDTSIPANELKLSRKFYATSIITTLTKSIFLSLDLMLAKHFLSPDQAGLYSYLSLAGKMVFFLSTIVSQFLIPYVSRDVGAGKSPYKKFLTIFYLVALCNVIGVMVFGVLGGITAPILWGKQALAIVAQLPLYTTAMALFSLSALIITYQQVRGRMIFPFVGLFVGVLQVLGMIWQHKSIDSLVMAVFISGLASLIIVVLLSKYYRVILDGYRAVKDFVDLFKPFAPTPKLAKNKKRILIFNWRDKKHKWAGGAEVYMYELAKRWVQRGHKVTIFSGNDGKARRHEIDSGIRIIRRGGFYLVYFWAAVYYYFRFRGRFDIIIDSENGLPFFTPVYAKEKIYLLIHHVHQEVFRKSLVPPFSWLASFLEKRIMPLVYRKTEVITVSPSSRDEILSHGLTKKEPHIIYNGVDSTLYKPGKKSKKPSIAYVGRLTTAKSIHVLLHAIKVLQSKIPNLTVTIAGDGPAKSSLMHIADRLGIRDMVKFTGHVTDQEKIQILQQAWVFVNPSLIEGWGITTIEANACGTPVVVSNVAGLRDAVGSGKSGFVFAYGDSDACVQALQQLLTQKVMRNKMSRYAVKWAKNFDWDKSARKSEILFTRRKVS